MLRMTTRVLSQGMELVLLVLRRSRCLMRMRRLGGKRWVLLGRMSRSLLWSASVSYIARTGYSDSVRKTVTAKNDLSTRTCDRAYSPLEVA